MWGGGEVGGINKSCPLTPEYRCISHLQKYRQSERSDCLDCQGVTQEKIKELLSNLKSQAEKKSMTT
jgi:hypothetical protein